MANFIRYSLATVFLAASVGCLALWWRSMSHLDHLKGGRPHRHAALSLISLDGQLEVARITDIRNTWLPNETAGFLWVKFDSRIRKTQQDKADLQGFFGSFPGGFYFPLWYPALIFALAAVAAIRVGRRFTLRSALVGVTAVAALLGMVVAL